MVNRFMKGVFHLRPPKPRYAETWDVGPVLQKLKSMSPLHELSLRELTLKLVMLMALTQAARVQTLHLLVLDGILINQNSITLPLGGNIKQCRPNFNVQTVQFQAYPADPRLCVCETLQTYILRTEALRQDVPHSKAFLFISFVKPHKAVSRDTIARWIKTMLQLTGINTSRFTAGSTRPAAASKAKAMAVPIACIMAKAGWTNERTFARFYDKNIIPIADTFQEAVLA